MLSIKSSTERHPSPSPNSGSQYAIIADLQPTGWNTSYNRWDTGNPYTRGYQQSAAYQQTTAPYAAVDNGYRRGYYGQSYAQQSGLVCTPGTRYRGDDGRRHARQGRRILRR